MTSNLILTATAPRAAPGRAAWISPAMIAARRLFLALGHRHTRSVKLRLRLATQDGRVVDEPPLAYGPLSMTWWWSDAETTMSCPIMVFLSRQYFLDSGLRRRSTGSGEVTKKRFSGIYGINQAEATSISTIARWPLASQVLQLATGGPAPSGNESRHAVNAPLALQSMPGPATAARTSTAATNGVHVLQQMHASLPPVPMIELVKRQAIVSNDKGIRKEGLERSAPLVLQHVRSRRLPDATASPTSPGDALYDQAMHQWRMTLPGQQITAGAAPTASSSLQTISDTRQSNSGPAMPMGVTAPPAAAALSREEVSTIADRVAQVLGQRERFERERQGKY